MRVANSNSIAGIRGRNSEFSVSNCNLPCMMQQVRKKHAHDLQGGRRDLSELGCTRWCAWYLAFYSCCVSPGSV